MGQNSALKARIKHAKKNTKKGKLLAQNTKDLKPLGKGNRARFKRKRAI